MTFTSFELHAARLLSAHRWAALATLGRGWPICLDGSCAPEPDPGSLVLFLSSLSERTRNLINSRRVSLVISETDPVTAIRRHWPVSVSRGRPRWSSGPHREWVWRRYVARLPDAGSRLLLGDFSLFRVVVGETR